MGASWAWIKETPVDLRVQQGTSTRHISVGKLLPQEWEMVRVYVTDEGDGLATWRVQQLHPPTPEQIATPSPYSESP